MSTHSFYLMKIITPVLLIPIVSGCESPKYSHPPPSVLALNLTTVPPFLCTGMQILTVY